ncbi:hypothetical protein AS149_14490 [Burkholderia cenocepacia]|nr:hypothetical protein AS149_14490 [Burkholderia cenocepacia]
MTLRQKLSRGAVCAALVLSAFPVVAQEASAPAAASDPLAMPYVPYGNLKNASPADIAKATEVGKSVVNDLMSAYEKRKDDPTLEQTMRQVKTRADQIADESIAANRDKVLDFLGIDPESQNALYYFVSWSMPLEMLRSYAIEAMWNGGTLVFKGVPPGRTFGQFLGEDMSKLTYGKGASANASIDPRLFDAYKVTTVPTIVLTTYRKDLQCVGEAPAEFQYRGQSLSYDVCPPLDESKYAKVSGAVTSSYALQMFLDDGWTQAKPFMKALSQGYALGKVPQKEQQPFSGHWEDVVSPAERMALREAAANAQTPAASQGNTPAGITLPDAAANR